MSAINKLDSNIAQQCSFTPDQFKVNVTTKIDNDITAPIGSFPWAIIQVYLGKKVFRRNWTDPVEYIQLVSDSSPLIEKRQQDNITAWQPTPEDLTACDWELHGPYLEFDLTVGIRIFESSDFPWGYISKGSKGSTGFDNIGTLKLVRNNSDIKNITAFFFWIDTDLTIQALSDNNQESHQKMAELFSKNLTVIVDDVHYVIGRVNTDKFKDELPIAYEVAYYADSNNDIKKLGDLLQQNAGKTLRLRLLWNDN
ncbi:Thoeris anti-defense Tad2 family protein [Xenorhabdus taiwanensis]|uniref:Uncharacterized protein n=1 Tax=Xenorhabdus taiwanensis TaxID=3085177 RepID=A0ABN7BYD7_9GAMM|nr:hypothetical protein TCT1_01120 [Xenorhabdus sp. TCT-1]